MTALGRVKTGRSRARLWAVAFLGLSGCHSAGETTDQLVPRGFRGNPWGPQANAMRERGEIPIVPNNPDMAAWEIWGKANLHDGDILLRMGDARAAMGLLPFSKLSAAIAGSRFSHSGIVAREGDEVVVYDTTTTGPQRQPFPIWLLDARGSFAVKRPKAEYQAQVPRAVEFCRAAYLKQIPFDYNMKLGDEKLYCIELTERAYQTSGVPLSKPLRLDELPRYRDYPKLVRLLKLATPMVPEQRAYVIGNESIGIWASPALETLYDAPHGRPPGAIEPMIAGRPANGTVRR